MNVKVLFFIFCCQVSLGQIDLDEHILEQALITERATDAVLGDIDGDGDLDLVTSSSEDNKIAWNQREDGDNSFGIQNTISAEVLEAISVALGDVDGDGDLDVLAGSKESAEVIWFENLDGLGNFSEAITVSTGEFFLADADFTDLDSDGDLDILVTGRRLTFFENTDGLGSFEANLIQASLAEFFASFVADVDNDGDLDILFTKEPTYEPYSNPTLGWAENTDGAGSFDEIHELDYFNEFMYDIVGADFDNDNDIDILVTGSGGLFEFENLDGLGTFGDVQPLIDVSSRSRIASEDIDSDGDMDIVFGDHTINIMMNNGAGSFDAPILVTEDVNSTRNIGLHDLDLDGDFDIITASFWDNRVAWHENLDGLGNFGDQINLTEKPKNPTSIYAANLNLNCKVDILVDSWNDGEVFWYENLDSSGAYSESNLITDQNLGGVHVYTADLDGDDDNDLIIGPSQQSAPERLSWMRNLDGNGNFGSQIILEEYTSSNEAVSLIVDLDQDGDFDIFVAKNVSGGLTNLSWFENTDGSGNFAPSVLIASVEILKFDSLSFGDIDGDTDLDIVLTGSYWDPAISEVVWLENLDGMGTFGDKQQIEFISGDSVFYRNISIVDLDNDNDLDVVINSFTQNAIFWFENTDGNGNFGPRRIIQDTDFSRQTDLVDLDLDGDLDVVSATSDEEGENRSLVYYEHLDGLGTFGSQVQIQNFAGSFPRFTINDLDLDGDMDIAYAFFNRVGWFENLAITSEEACPESGSDEDDSEDDEDATETEEDIIEGTTPFPNPTLGPITVESEFPIASLTVYNIIGDLVAFNTAENQIDISSLGTGLYFLKITHTDGSEVVRKIIKN